MLLHALTPMLAAGGSELTSPAIESFKAFVNAISVPEISLPIFTALFIAMFMLYRQWTKPLVFWTLFVVACVLYFGSIVIDADYRLIVLKPDNVPITLMLIGTAITLWLGLRQAAINDANMEAGRPLIEEDKDNKVLVWPDLVYTELIAIVIGTAVLVIWAIALRAPLEAPANPAGPPNPSKAPWYFLGLQEMLVYFDPWMAGVLLPGMIVTGLIAMPYIDTNPKGNGYYTLKQRPFAIITWMFGFLILWIVLIVFGTFLRGPNWNFFGPYEYWDSHLQVPLTNVNLSDYFWLWWAGQPLPTADNPIIPGMAYWLTREFFGIILVGLWMAFFLFLPWVPLAMDRIPVIGWWIIAPTRRLCAQMGVVRYWILAIHFGIMAMLPVKMVLRWLYNLKYFVYLPEFNLNL